ncbi:MAG: hypothetical protein RLZZ488_520 [Pseudomonadota bacterium]|jgi:ABC-type multidrug transport system ATPase subunit
MNKCGIAMDDCVLTVSSLNAWRSGRWLLRDISCDFPSGSVAVLAGRNGSGKTTFLRSLASLLLSSDGWRVTGVVRSAQRVAYLGQNLPLNEDMTVSEFFRLTSSGGDEWIQMHSRFAIGELASLQLSQLSGGQWQRIRLAQCLSNPAPLVLLDEPDSFLDRPWRGVLLDCLSQRAARGDVVVVALHRPEEAKSIATHWLGFESGSLMFCESGRDVYPNELLGRLFLVKRLDSPEPVD